MEIAPSHLDDRAEAAVERATAGRLHDVYLPADHGVARENASIPIGTPDLTAFQTCHGPVGVVEKATIAAIGQTWNVRIVAIALDRPDQVPEGDLPFAPDQEIRRLTNPRIRLGRQTRIIAAHGDPRLRAERTQYGDQPQCGGSLEGHHRQPHEVGLELSDESLHRFSDTRLDQNQIGDGYAMMRVEVTGERCERTVGHSNRQGGHVLERVRHGEQEHAHVASPEQAVRSPSLGRFGSGATDVDGFHYCAFPIYGYHR